MRPGTRAPCSAGGSRGLIGDETVNPLPNYEQRDSTKIGFYYFEIIYNSTPSGGGGGGGGEDFLPRFPFLGAGAVIDCNGQSCVRERGHCGMN